MDSHFMGSAVSGSRQTPQSIYWLDLGHLAQTVLHGRLVLPVPGQWLWRTKVEALMKLNMKEGLNGWIISTLFSMIQSPPGQTLEMNFCFFLNVRFLFFSPTEGLFLQVYLPCKQRLISELINPTPLIL